MGFSEVISVPAIALGGIDKKTGKPNVKQMEGYLLRTREVPDQKKKSGVSYIYEFQTKSGIQAVWGKTDMDRKLRNVMPGTMVRVTWTGMKPTPAGDMYIYKVEQDTSNVIEVNEPEPAEEAAEEPDYSSSAEVEDAPIGQDEAAPDEVTPARATAPAMAVKVDAARVAKVKALLAAGKK